MKAVFVKGGCSLGILWTRPMGLWGAGLWLRSAVFCARVALVLGWV